MAFVLALFLVTLTVAGDVFFPWGSADTDAMGPVSTAPPEKISIGTARTDTHGAVADRIIFLPVRTLRNGDVVRNDEDPLAHATVMGVMIFSSKKMVVIRLSPETPVKQYEVGQLLEGWTISDIFFDKISLSKDGQKRELKLHPLEKTGKI